MGGPQGIARDLGAHLAIAQDEVRENGEHRMTGRALDPPDGKATEANPCIMRVAGETPAAATGRFVRELKANREEEGEDELDKRLGIAQKRKVGEA